MSRALKHRQHLQQRWTFTGHAKALINPPGDVVKAVIPTAVNYLFFFFTVKFLRQWQDGRLDNNMKTIENFRSKVQTFHSAHVGRESA